jgi:hypothetical protein
VQRILAQGTHKSQADTSVHQAEASFADTNDESAGGKEDGWWRKLKDFSWRHSLRGTDRPKAGLVNPSSRLGMLFGSDCASGLQ